MVIWVNALLLLYLYSVSHSFISTFKLWKMGTGAGDVDIKPVDVYLCTYLSLFMWELTAGEWERQEQKHITAWR